MAPKPRNNGARGTSSRAFGSSSRVNHDSSRFYNSKLYMGQTKEESSVYEEATLPPEVLDHVLCASSEDMAAIPDNSVHLMVTSPPYNAGKVYDENLTLGEYLAFLRRSWEEVYRVLVPGGRACVNIANLGRRPYLPFHASIINEMIDIGFLMRGELIWQKGSSAGGSTAWGSWLSPSNPTLRDTHEYIMVFCKGSFRRQEPKDKQATITRDQFLEFTKSVWTFPSESANRIGHPAPFPLELPYRLIQLYTYEGDVVLDPFIGSGQTALAAMKSHRHFVGYEIDEEYASLARKRIKEFETVLLSEPLFRLPDEGKD